jgi:ABC-type dipeptide/oligopeptide/nickel transport system permease subunit
VSALPVPLRQGWTALLSRIDAMSLRERMMVFVALLMLVLAINLVGDGLRDVTAQEQRH